MRRSRIGKLTCAGLFSMVLGAGVASAQGSSSKSDVQRRQPPPSTATDTAKAGTEKQFVSQAAMANMAEIQLGHLAVMKAQQPDVKKFGQTMIDDHVKAQKDLADAASGAGVQWPKGLDGRHREIHQRLSTLSDEQFDREYMKAMVDGHREVEKMLVARIGEDGSESAARAPAPPSGLETSLEAVLTANVTQWTVKTLPEVRAHLKKAEQVYGTLEKRK